jgi:prolyl-tRNA synthetase
VKFADADLIGIPVRINVGDRGLKEGKIELKPRKSPDAEMVALDGVLARVRELLSAR